MTYPAPLNYVQLKIISNTYLHQLQDSINNFLTTISNEDIISIWEIQITPSSCQCIIKYIVHKT